MGHSDGCFGFLVVKTAVCDERLWVCLLVYDFGDQGKVTY